MHSSFKVSLVAGVVAVASQSALANSYTIVDLGDHREAVAINADGVVAGNRSDGTRGEIYRGGKWHNLTPVSYLFGLSERGTAVGTRDSTLVPTLWPFKGAPITIGVPSGSYGNAAAINRKEVVAGWYIPEGDTRHRCYTWSARAGGIDLGLMAQGLECTATAINAKGQVTGQAPTSGQDDRHAFLWDHGTFQDLGVLPGSDTSAGYAVNVHGVVVGSVTQGPNEPRAFRWHGRMIDLDPDRDYARSTALAINDVGVVVGWAQTEGCTTQAARFADRRIVELRDEVANLGDWDLRTAVSVNDQGVIVGTGFRSSGGFSHAFMLVPAAGEQGPTMPRHARPAGGC